MKIICLQENLKNNIAILERICSKNQTLPILQNVLLKTQDGFLKMFSTDLEIGISIQVPCKIEKEGEIMLSVKLLLQFISQIPNTKITIEEKGKSVFIQTSDFQITIPLINKNEFPIIPKIKKENVIHIHPALLKESLLQVSNSLPASSSISEISGVLFNFLNDMLYVVSTDSFRLSEKIIYKKNDNYKIKSEVSFIVPQKTVYELLRIINQIKDIEICIEKNQVTFLLENITVISRLISGEYPNYQQIIPKTTKTKIILNKNEFLSKIKLASIFASQINEIKLTINTKKNILEIYSENIKKGNFNSSLPVEINGEGFEVVYNYKYLLDGLLNIQEDEVFFELNNASSGAILKSKNSNYIYIIMPIKT